MRATSAARGREGDLRRLIAFIAASVALHAFTVMTYGPAGVHGARPDAVVPVLQATLTRVESAARQSGDTGSDALGASDSEQSSDRSRSNAAMEASRAGDADALDLPTADKWFSADELDVRAEPLRDISIDYPAALQSTGTVGRVQVLLFIDERGFVRRSRVVAATPEGFFEKAALEPWNDVRFSPAMKNGAAVKSRKLIELYFSPL